MARKSAAGPTEPSNGRPTIKDVARVAGVSASTTSRALRGQGYVAAEVKTRIQQAAAELGYVPDVMAQHLRQRVSRSIGVLVSDLRNTFYADLAAGASRAAKQAGYTMMLVDDRLLIEEELEASEAFASMRVAGVVVTPLSAQVSQYLHRHQVPVVEVDRQFAPDLSDAVVVDNRPAAQRVTDHLIGLGHRRIALLVDETDWTTGRDRVQGYRESLTEGGIDLDDSLVVSAGWDVEAAQVAAVELLQRPDRPTAVFAANNVLAEAAWRAATQLGLRIPDELSLVSFDEAPWMSMVTPGITTVRQDAVRLGKAAVERLLERIADPGAIPSTVVVPVEIAVRGSISAPHA